MNIKEGICTGIGVLGSVIASLFGGWDKAREVLIDYFKIYKPCNEELEENPTITGYDPINVTATAVESVNNYTGRFGNLPYYVRVNWSDGSKTEHPVRWERIHGSSKQPFLQVVVLLN